MPGRLAYRSAACATSTTQHTLSIGRERRLMAATHAEATAKARYCLQSLLHWRCVYPYTSKARLRYGRIHELDRGGTATLLTLCQHLKSLLESAVETLSALAQWWYRCHTVGGGYRPQQSFYKIKGPEGSCLAANHL